MGVMSAAQYIESLKKLNLKVYMFGELVDKPTEHPIIVIIKSRTKAVCNDTFRFLDISFLLEIWVSNGCRAEFSVY